MGIVTLASCAPKPPSLPSGPGTAFPGYAAAYQEATASCQHVTTLTVSMAMSGRAGTTKLRGRIDAGFAAPGKVRLEGIAPFGRPVFVLVGDGSRATLVLTRADQVLADAPADRIVEALAGVPLGADALRTIVAGCGFPDGAPSAGAALHAYNTDWVVLTFPGSTGYLARRNGAWRLVAATRGSLTATYANVAAGRPGVIRLRAVNGGTATADLTLSLSDVAINATLDPKTFDADLPQHPIPITLDELRRAGPLGGS